LQYDVAIIGGGIAGLSALESIAESGMKAALFDGHPRLGMHHALCPTRRRPGPGCLALIISAVIPASLRALVSRTNRLLAVVP
jgi:heterodisulfide reductase subunit A-like polyferredoxin